MIKIIILADWMDSYSEISCISFHPFRKIKDLIYGLWHIMQQFVFFRFVFTTCEDVNMGDMKMRDAEAAAADVASLLFHFNFSRVVRDGIANSTAVLPTLRSCFVRLCEQIYLSLYNH